MTLGEKGKPKYINLSAEDILSETGAELLTSGWRGKIYTARVGQVKVAIKIPKAPEFRENIKREIEILKKVNRAGVGVELLAYGKDFLITRFVEGAYFRDILDDETKRKLASRCFLSLLGQAYTLDGIHISKDEMHKPYTNVIVEEKSGEPILIDFESARETEKPKNVTQFFSFFVSFAKWRGLIFNPEEKKAIQLMREYKKDYSQDAFGKLSEFMREILRRW